MEIKSYRTWIEISRAALISNYKIFRLKAEKDALLMGIIKSNAYGHGLMLMAQEYADLGFDWLGVDSITEANRLRKDRIKKPILVLGYTQAANFPAAAAQKISLTLSSFDALKSLRAFRKKIAVHIKIDTGMHRQGFSLSDIGRLLPLLLRSPWISVEGLYTHFASAKDPRQGRETKKQLGLFSEAIARFHDAGFAPIVHAAATGGGFNFPEARFDMIRAGIGMYGYWPSSETREVYGARIRLKPVLTWKTIISELKWVEKGERVGYDYTERLARRSRLAVLPVGYWHGYWRAFSGKAHVLVRGKRCRVVGRVAMDMTVIDVTDVLAVRMEDEVVLMGRQGRQEVTADELGLIAKTSSYEIITRLNPLIKRYSV